MPDSKDKTKKVYSQTTLHYDVFVSNALLRSQAEWPGSDTRSLKQSTLFNYKQPARAVSAPGSGRSEAAAARPRVADGEDRG